MIRWCAAACIALGLAGAARAADSEEAARLQVEHWIDLEQHGLAVAFTRRASRARPEDLGWHLARLRALHAAGMTDWIAAEYVERNAPEVPRNAYAIWRFEAGESDVLELEGPDADSARARKALAAGDVAGAAAMPVEDEALVARIAVAVAVSEGDDAAALGSWARPYWGALVPVWSGPHRGKARKAAAALHEQATDVARASDTSVAELLRLAFLASEAGDKALAVEVSQALARRSHEASDLQAVMDGLATAPSDWGLWQAARRGAWRDAMLDVSVTVLARRQDTELPWARPTERARLARKLAAVLEQDGRSHQAAEVLANGLSPCGPSLSAWASLHNPRAAGARPAAIDALTSCVGELRLVPDVDPAGLDVAAQFDRAADAWFHFGMIAKQLERHDEAVLALGIALRLAPSRERLAVAREATRLAGTAHEDGVGVPTVAQLLEMLDGASWLHGGSVVSAGRSQRTRLRTAALLQGTPAQLAARVTPSKTCLPTMRAACMLEYAVARAAYAEAGEDVPDNVPKVRDRGAKRAAATWVASWDLTWFNRRARLGQLLHEVGRVDIQHVVTPESSLRVGEPAPDIPMSLLQLGVLEGRPAVVAFWSSEAPCDQALAWLDARAGTWRDAGLRVAVVAVGLDQEAQVYEAELDKNKGQVIQNVWAPDLRDAYEVDALPKLLFWDRDRVLRHVSVGYDEAERTALDAAVRQWTAATSSPGRTKANGQE